MSSVRHDIGDALWCTMIWWIDLIVRQTPW